MEQATWYDIPIVLAKYTNATDDELQQGRNWLKDNGIDIKYGDGVRFQSVPYEPRWGRQICLWNGTGLEKLHGLQLPLDANPIYTPFPVIDEGKCRDGVVREFPVGYWNHWYGNALLSFTIWAHLNKYKDELFKNMRVAESPQGWKVMTKFTDSNGNVRVIAVTGDPIRTKEDLQMTVNWLGGRFSSSCPVNLTVHRSDRYWVLRMHNYANIGNKGASAKSPSDLEEAD